MKLEYIKTKNQLVKLLEKISQDKLKQSVEILRLAQSINHFKDDKKLNEWILFCKEILNNSKYLEVKEREVLI